VPRRGDADPLLLQAVSERLARLLAETPPRRAAEEAEEAEETGPAVATETPDADSWLDTELLEADDVPPPRRFNRRHLVVVCVLLLVGLVWAGWSVFRAQPVALASPVSVSVSAVATGPPGSSLPATPAPTVTASATAGATAQPTPADVVVHVLGAVRKPGLVTLEQRARVQDAVDAAGGFTRDADPGDLNLAQPLQDGQQVVIGTAARPSGEVRGSGATSGGSSPGAASGTGSAGTGSVLDLNTATEVQLEELPGVGPVTAAKIAGWRTEHGRFSKVEELQEVDGIGPKTYAEIAPHVRV
jgi:competence protein ComEA